MCRRGHCARRAVLKGGVSKSLSSSAGARRPFGDALIALCVAAEKLEGVDSSERWDVVREPGTPSRQRAVYSRHITFFNQPINSREGLPDARNTRFSLVMNDEFVELNASIEVGE